MSIDLGSFEDALNTTLKNAVTAGQITGISTDQVAWPWKTFVPVKGVCFLKPELAARVRQPVGFGADAVQQWNGSYQIGIFLPRDTGTRLQNQIASDILRVFKRGLALQTSQGVWLTLTRSTAPVSVPFGDWINLPLQADWAAFEPPPGELP